MKEMRNTYTVLFGAPENMREFGGHRYRWKDNIKIDLIELGSVCALDSSSSG
jgi:hypothetical protein